MALFYYLVWGKRVEKGNALCYNYYIWRASFDIRLQEEKGIIMRSEYFDIPLVKSEREEGETLITVYECLCGKGEIEHHWVRGFGDEHYRILCTRCKRKYEPYITRIGDEWEVDFK